MSAAAEKKTEGIKVWLSEPLELELRRMADLDNRKFGDYLGLILRQYVYGHAPKIGDSETERQAGE